MVTFIFTDLGILGKQESHLGGYDHTLARDLSRWCLLRLHLRGLGLCRHVLEHRAAPHEVEANISQSLGKGMRSWSSLSSFIWNRGG